MNPSLNILLIDDSETRAEAIMQHLGATHADPSIKRVRDSDRFEEALASGCWDLILCEHSSPNFQSAQVLDLYRKHDLQGSTFMVISGLTHQSPIPISMHRGTHDFIFKADAEHLKATISPVEKAPIPSDAVLIRGMPPVKHLRINSLLDQLHDGLRARTLPRSSEPDSESDEALPQPEKVRPLLPTPCGHQACHLLCDIDFDECDPASVVDRVCNSFCRCPEKKKTPVDVNAALLAARAKTNTRWLREADTKRLAIDVAVHCHATRTAWGDRAQLRDVISSLIYNSCDAMAETGGSIKVLSRDVENEVEIVVSDNGPGMSEQVRNRCFDPLFTTKDEEGTGLGLSIAERIVEFFGGGIRVESLPDEGTTVTLTLSGVDQQDRPGKNGPVLKALVVDDDPAAASFVERHLLRLGHSPVSISNPLEAVELLQFINFDLVLSDRTMPKLSGDDLALQLRSNSPDIRFAMVTGHGDRMIADGELPDGVDIIVPKPISNETLRGALDMLFPGDADLIALAR